MVFNFRNQNHTFRLIREELFPQQRQESKSDNQCETQTFHISRKEIVFYQMNKTNHHHEQIPSENQQKINSIEEQIRHAVSQYKISQHNDGTKRTKQRRIRSPCKEKKIIIIQEEIHPNLD